jgi:hypothetical protein
LLHSRKPRREKRIARINALAPQRGHRQFRKLRGFYQVFGVAFVINGQLFASVDAVMRISNNFQPDLGGARVFAAALGHYRQLAPRFGTKFRWQPNRQGLGASGVRAIVLPAPLQKS